MTAKEKHRQNLLEYLANPENVWPDRATLSIQVLGFANRQSIYKHFSLDEFQEIEQEALEIRRTKYAAQLAMIDKGLLERAKTGDPQACKLVYQKFEGWAERQEHTGKGGGPIETRTVPPEIQDKVDDIIKSAGGK